MMTEMLVAMDATTTTPVTAFVVRRTSAPLC